MASMAISPGFVSFSGPQASAPKGPLYANRPKEIQDAIEANYEVASTAKYKNNGNKEYRLELANHFHSSDEVLETIAPKGSTLLDLGTGNGDFLLHAEERHGVRATGITANDMRLDSDKSKFREQQFQLGNVENISTWSSDRYNNMIGSWIFNHLTDPLGTIEALYDNHLEVGGYIIVHKINIHCGDQKNPAQFMEELVDHLNRTGNCRAAVAARRSESVQGVPMAYCDFLFIQKLNDKPLDLPVAFLDKPITNRFNSKVFAGYQFDPSRNIRKCDSKDSVIAGCSIDNPIAFFR